MIEEIETLRILNRNLCFPHNQPMWNDSRIIARFDQREGLLLSVLHYFCTLSWISKLFNRDISPGLSLSCDSSHPFDTSSLSSPSFLSAFLVLPLLPETSLTLNTNTMNSRKISRDTLRLYADARIGRAKALLDILFHSTKKSFRCQTLILSHSFSLSFLRTWLSSLVFSLFLSLSIHTHFTVTLISLSFSFSIYLFVFLSFSFTPESARLLSSLCLSYLFELCWVRVSFT